MRRDDFCVGVFLAISFYLYLNSRFSLIYVPLPLYLVTSRDDPRGTQAPRRHGASKIRRSLAGEGDGWRLVQCLDPLRRVLTPSGNTASSGCAYVYGAFLHSRLKKNPSARHREAGQFCVSSVPLVRPTRATRSPTKTGNEYLLSTRHSCEHIPSSILLAHTVKTRSTICLRFFLEAHTTLPLALTLARTSPTPL